MSAQAGAGSAACRLASLHLRTGLHRLARVELEELAGQGRLDTAGILDLAEARWRTGDLRGATEAAGAWLEAGTPGTAAAGDDLPLGRAHRKDRDGRARALAHALIAEGLTVRGRHEDAAIHVVAALEALEAGPAGSVAEALDALFAGIAPRADAWPAFGPGDAGSGPSETAVPGVEARPRPASPEPSGPDPLAAAGERLGAGDDAGAAVLLIVALRTSPARAGEVLERAEAALSERPGAALLLVRAEALRALGRHEAAGIAYAVAGAHARDSAPARSHAPGTRIDDPVRAPAVLPDPAATDPERSPS